MSAPRSVAVALAVAAGTLTLWACSGDETKSVPVSECAAGTRWVGDDEGSPKMYPGRDCVSCHAGNDGPNFTLAGTVFGAAGQDDDCFGVGGVSVEVTGADGVVTTLTANEAGNFYTDNAIAMPYTAKVRTPNGERAMQAAQSTGACNSCHTTTGANSAPGRILAP
ncbi:MAG: hypothetical protein MUF34_35590 [Polyangiaceae bacterium]|jgi:hypothetical protein|nr:hypothetical protein [Polyangiaceae bacterium]